MLLTGIGDEAAASLDVQLDAARELGWNYLEMRGVSLPGHAKANFHDLDPAMFDQAASRLETSGIGVYCFGSTIMNWSRRVTEPFAASLEEVQRAIPRMQRLGTRYVRIMSFKP